VPSRQEVPFGAEIEAAAIIPASPEEVFAFLSDLSNHWRLVDRFVEVIELCGPPDGPPDSGLVRLRGPLGVRRTVRTRVTASRSPRLIIGTAELGASTRARVSWTVAGRLGQTRVRLAAEVERATVLDRLLLACGGRVWLRRRFAFGLERLAERFMADAVRSAARSGQPLSPRASPRARR
jgi:Polyketide cyclase / dehydrase and lipid transport